ncbi:MAG: hypothetical protein WAL61_13660 [Acidimicrobiales bacterium]
MTTATLGDDIAELLGLSPSPTPAWPPPSFFPPSWDHPTTSWTWELLAYAKQLPADVAHFPAVLAAQDIVYRGVATRVVLIGVRLHAHLDRPPMTRSLRRGEDGAWGGVVELNGTDLLDRRDARAPGDEGRAGVLSYATRAGVLTETFVVALTVTTEPMTIERHVVDRDGHRVPASSETWLVEAGVVRRVD